LSEYGTKLVGGGWNVYDQIEIAGDVGGASHTDVVARDRSGVLWLYLGRGDGTFAARSRIGGGWNAYGDLVGTGDADRDGKPDLFAYDKTHNRTCHYHGTGNWRAPFAARKPSMSPSNTGNPYSLDHMA
jgi:hypothetical protein